MSSELYIKQDEESGDITITCCLVPEDDGQVTLVEGQWIKVATCEPGKHTLRVGTILASGHKTAKLLLMGGTFGGSDTIEDIFSSPTDGR